MPLRACRSCGDEALEPVLSLGNLPLANAFVSPESRDVPDERFPLDLVFCRSCSLLQLADTVPPDRLFTEYPYFSSQSQTFVDHAADLVGRVVEDLGLGDGDLAMEIASNDGYLLQHYRSAGISVLGVDPARNVAKEAERRGVRTIPEFFDVELAERLRAEGIRPKVIHANNVLAHVPDIRQFVAGVSLLISDDGVVIIETPYVRDLVEKLEFDTIYHEHVFYYSLASLRTLLEASSLNIVDVERVPVHGGSLRVFASKNGSGTLSPRVGELERQEKELGLDSVGYYSSFSDRVDDARREISDFLRGLQDQGSRLAAYGAAAKGTMLLNSLSLDAGAVEYVVDSTPYKQGRLVPGVRVPIEPPDHLSEDPPDYVVLLAWNFAREIIDREAGYVEQGGRFIVPLPSPYVVRRASEVID
jgi:C-methyltransferase-like protein/putative zinc binding protein/methyltransferase family protein